MSRRFVASCLTEKCITTSFESWKYKYCGNAEQQADKFRLAGASREAASVLHLAAAAIVAAAAVASPHRSGGAAVVIFTFISICARWQKMDFATTKNVKFHFKNPLRPPPSLFRPLFLHFLQWSQVCCSQSWSRRKWRGCQDH